MKRLLLIFAIATLAAKNEDPALPARDNQTEPVTPTTTNVHICNMDDREMTLDFNGRHTYTVSANSTRSYTTEFTSLFLPDPSGGVRSDIRVKSGERALHYGQTMLPSWHLIPEIIVAVLNGSVVGIPRGMFELPMRTPVTSADRETVEIILANDSGFPCTLSFQRPNDERPREFRSNGTVVRETVSRSLFRNSRISLSNLPDYNTWWQTHNSLPDTYATALFYVTRSRPSDEVRTFVWPYELSVVDVTL